MIYSVILFIFIFTNIVNSFNDPIPIHITDPNAIDATDFAMSLAYDHRSYNTRNSFYTNIDSYKLVYAYKQIYLKTKYTLIVEVTMPNGVCIVKKFAVYIRERLYEKRYAKFLTENVLLRHQYCNYKYNSNYIYRYDYIK